MKRNAMLSVLSFVFVLAMVFGTPNEAHASYRRAPNSDEEVQLSYAPIVKKTAPAVVNIYTTKLVKERAFSPFMGDPFFRHFFGNAFPSGSLRQRYENSLGSGVLVKPEGVIVTSNHVIDGSDEIKVVLSDRREFEAKLLLTDKRSDLAVLKIETNGEQMPYLEMQDSDDVEVGDMVLAIGNPFGVGQSVTTGIVSALARTSLDINDINYYIQTDAAINPGNSGGALVGMDGRLIGINAAIYTRDGGNMGLGFAVPSNMVKATLKNADSGQTKVQRPWTGIEGQAVTADMAQSLGLKYPIGMLVKKVHKASPSHKKGLKAGDLIISVNGKEVSDPSTFAYRVATLSTGDVIELGLIRSGKKYTLSVDLVAPPEIPAADKQQVSGNNPLSGAVIANLSPSISEEYGLPMDEEGVVVIGASSNAIASRLGLQKGDVLLMINGVRVDNVSDVLKEIRGKRAQWRIVISRDGRKIQLVLRG